MSETLMSLVESCKTELDNKDLKYQEKLDKLNELKDLGFEQYVNNQMRDLSYSQNYRKAIENGFWCIADDKIEKFLKAKVELNKHEIFKQQLIREDKFDESRLNAFLKRINQFKSNNLEEPEDLPKIQVDRSHNIYEKLKHNLSDKDMRAYYANIEDSVYAYYEFDRFRYGFKWTESLLEHCWDLPPQNVLDKLAEVKKLNLFDAFTIAKVESAVLPIKDPLLCGKFKDDFNRYFIAQWGDDVTLDDLI